MWCKKIFLLYSSRTQTKAGRTFQFRSESRTCPALSGRMVTLNKKQRMSSLVPRSSSPNERVWDTEHRFEKLRYYETYVDKTLFIKAFFEADAFVLVTAPRRFGKSSNIDMLKQFLRGRVDLFEGTNIWKHHKNFFVEHCKPHPVISVNFGTVRGTSYDQVLDAIRRVVHEAFFEHIGLVAKVEEGYIWQSEKLRTAAGFNANDFGEYIDSEMIQLLKPDKVASGLKYLSQVLHQHYDQNVFILIDEYDAPALHAISNANLTKKDTEMIYEMLQGIMSNTVKFNDYAERALLAACVQLAGAGSGASRTVITKYPFLNGQRFEKFFGFTTEEVNTLLDKPKFHILKGRRQDVDKWYDGYEPSCRDTKIYNTWDILNVLEDSITEPIPDPLFRSHWIDTGLLKNINALFAKPLIRSAIEKLINNTEVTIKTKELSVDDILILKDLMELRFSEPEYIHKDLFLQFLADSGYLCATLDKEQDNMRCYKLKVPNQEIREYLVQCCYDSKFTVQQYNLKLENVAKFVKKTCDVLKHATDEIFEEFTESVANIFSGAKLPKNEDEFHSIIYTLLYDHRAYDVGSEVHVIKSKTKAGRPPRLDILVVMGKSAIILEIKFHQCTTGTRQLACDKITREGLAQIFDHGYDDIFEQKRLDVSRKIYAALCFHESKKISICHIENSKVAEDGKLVFRLVE